MNNTGKTLLALTTGIILGAAAGILFAPQSGEETRKDIALKIDELKATIKDTLEKGGELVAENVDIMKKKLAQLEEEMKNKIEA